MRIQKFGDLWYGSFVGLEYGFFVFRYQGSRFVIELDSMVVVDGEDFEQ